MPNYDYRCTECGNHFEVFQKMTDPKLETCPECQGKVERLIGPGAGIVFKGSGFYQTDYRSESYKKAAKAETGGGGKESSGKSESGTAKGAKKGDAKEPKKSATTNATKKPPPGGKASAGS
jgi:putative FmdB family regulatory protein